MKFLGIKIGDHDSNFSLSDGSKVFYHKSEREKQIKHFGSTDPLIWIKTLKDWGYSPKDLDAICVVSDEELYRESLDESLNYHLINSEYWFPGIKCPVFRLDHHLAHALSVWPITDVMPNFSFVFDGDGDFGRCFSVFKGTKLIYSRSVEETQSFGQILENVGILIGVEGNRLDISGKLMALKSFGVVDEQYKKLFDVFNLETIHKFFDITMWETITQTEFKDSYLNYLSTIHHFADLKFPEFFKKFVNDNELISFTGGVAQNSVLNSSIQKKFKNCIIPPHASDDGLSLGCLEFLRIKFNQNDFDKTGFPFWQNDLSIENPSEKSIKEVAELLSQGKIVGWHQGKGEVGPRALGNRSILMDPRIINGKEILNNKVKHRENYRPFGCSILKEHVGEYFEMNFESPYMLHVSKIKKTAKLIPSVTHVDNTCRIHTVDENNIYYFKLLQQFNEITGCPLLLNTSLNDNNKPISSSEKDSINFFKNSELDALCVGDKIFKKIKSC